MPYSENAARLKKMIEKAIDDHVISRDEMDMIQYLAGHDGHIDRHEQAMLEQLHELIANGSVKIAR